ncbi:MAG: hypothetical protein HS101_08000 [Planctomycetia bacterium]|nr:hypothetical protein [Planctomycetia bacterium]
MASLFIALLAILTASSKEADVEFTNSDQFARTYGYLASFLGPKAENRNVFENLLLTILRDYVHWRANYYPGDDLLLTPQIERALQHTTDSLELHVDQMMAHLRRNFPFYSPRYLAHMLSDTSMPSMIGYFAGMLFNPNNVTTEAAPVTVEWELDSCNAAMEMLGFQAPPAPSKDQKAKDYASALPPKFGWSHLTFDGTTATMEAIWVARTVKYLPLAIRHVSRACDLQITVRLAGGEVKSIVEVEELELLLINPEHAISLLGQYIRTYTLFLRSKGEANISLKRAAKEAWRELRECPRDIVTRGCSEIFAAFPPVILATGAAHYCLRKAADLLGMGAASVVQIDMDDSFRMDMESLKENLKKVLDGNRIPLMVFAILGTTEEGAVDPLNEIVSYRRELEKTRGASFWLHVDAAWGGFIRSLFNWSKDEVWEEALLWISECLDLNIKKRDPKWLAKVTAAIRQFRRKNASPKEEAAWLSDLHEIGKQAQEQRTRGISEHIERLVTKLRQASLPIPENVFAFDDDRILGLVQQYVSATVPLSWKGWSEDVTLSWNDKTVLKSFLCTRDADSIVCDPHKMGYAVYPGGLVAFRDNQVRQFIRQKAPYITALGGRDDANLPPRYIEAPEAGSPQPESEGKDRLVVEALAPFILEGSRPGAAAASLWLATRVIPPTITNHGAIIRSSLLAARELYELIRRSTAVLSSSRVHPFRFIPVAPTPPDTNVVTFVVMAEGFPTLHWLNFMTDAVYERFSIRTELGDRHYSYAQPFFLSHHELSLPEYEYDFVKRFLDRNNVTGTEDEYKIEGVKILRAAIMNPYIWPMQRHSGQNLIREFLDALYDAATDAEFALMEARRKR